jgi:RNA polymerase sigma-70 factor (ECF subfamily)
MPRERGLEIAAAFYSASRSGDMDGLRSLLAADVVFYSDGGGKRPAAKRPLVGVDEVIQFHAAIARASAGRARASVRYALINGLPGFVTVEHDGVQTTALEIADGRIVGVYVMRNPDKLGRLGGEAIH